MKTADGKEIEHGMIVWPAHETEGDEGATVEFTLRDNMTGDVMGHGDTCDITTCYAVRQPQKPNPPGQTRPTTGGKQNASQ